MPLVNVYPTGLSQAQYEQTYLSLTTDKSFPGFLPGDASYDNQGGKWLFVLAGAAIAQYDLCSATFAAIPVATAATITTLTTTASRIIGIAQVAIASGSYGWIWLGGGGGVGRGIKVTAASTATTATKLYGTATAGQISSSVNAPLIQGLQTCTTGTGALEVYSTGILSVNAQD
jgi:hypothetical protein